MPADRIKESFHLVEPAGEITTYLSLWNSLGHPERLEAHQALVRWSSGHIPFPGAAFRQMVDLFIHDDSLVRGQVPLGNRVVDLADITVPVLSVTGARDKLVPVTVQCSARAARGQARAARAERRARRSDRGSARRTRR